jgi:hypothetical protein
MGIPIKSVDHSGQAGGGQLAQYWRVAMMVGEWESVF